MKRVKVFDVIVDYIKVVSYWLTRHAGRGHRMAYTALI